MTTTQVQSSIRPVLVVPLVALLMGAPGKSATILSGAKTRKAVRVDREHEEAINVK